MKVLVQEVEGEGFDSFLGKTICVYCMNYIYAGTLVGINKTCIKLENAKIVYDTGPLKQTSWTTAEDVYGGVLYIQLGTIESYGQSKVQ